MMTIIEKDAYRYAPGRLPFYQYCFRRCQMSRGPVRRFFLLLYKIAARSRGIEISVSCSIGAGLYIGHGFAITINSAAVIGKNCNIAKGVTIGQENRGKRKGTPQIGDQVWIGTNAVIVGRITIGDDVLIAPNSFVNCDVPSHSVVVGNPCRIYPRDNATEAYIEKLVE